jgi:phenylpyruvate tautomerase PptA (4-oxalocrotonate tautomerase family)
MPMINLTFPQGAFSDEAKAQLMEDLITTTFELEGSPDNDYSRSIARCFLDERPREAFWVGGKQDSEPFYRLEVIVPAGTPTLDGPLMKPRREELVERLTAHVLEAEGTEITPWETRRVMVILGYVAEDHWGAAGQLLGIRDIVAWETGDQEISKKGVGLREDYAALRAEKDSVPAS